MPTLEERFWPKVKKTAACWLWKGSKNIKGYGQIYNRETNAPILAHRAAWELLRGPVPEGQWVLHKCDNPACVNPEHMFIGDHVGNMNDASSKGRLSGERNGSAKLTWDQIAEIRRRYDNLLAALEKEFKVSKKYLAQDVLRGKRWTQGANAGERNSSAKLTWVQVRAIRASAEKSAVLEARYNISKMSVYLIRTHRSWKEKDK